MSDQSIAAIVSDFFFGSDKADFEPAKQKAEAGVKLEGHSDKKPGDNLRALPSADLPPPPKTPPKNDEVVEPESDKPAVQIPGAKIRVTQEYIDENGPVVVGTKGNDIFIIESDVKDFNIRGNGGKDKVIIKQSVPEIEFPKLPNE